MDLLLSLVMLAAVALIAGAIYRWRKEGFGKPVWLMLILAAIMIADVLIWAIPA